MAWVSGRTGVITGESGLQHPDVDPAAASNAPIQGLYDLGWLLDSVQGLKLMSWAMQR